MLHLLVEVPLKPARWHCTRHPYAAANEWRAPSGNLELAASSHDEEVQGGTECHRHDV